MQEFEFIKISIIKNVPVYAHWSMGLMIIFIMVASIEYTFLFVSIISIISVTLLHELGHMLLASKLGLKSYRINLYLFHATCERQSSENNFENYLIAWGGVLAQALVFIPSIIIFHLYYDQLPSYLLVALFFFGHVSLLTALLNLLPFKGFDGENCWKIIPYLIKQKL